MNFQKWQLIGEIWELRKRRDRLRAARHGLIRDSRATGYNTKAREIVSYKITRNEYSIRMVDAHIKSRETEISEIQRADKWLKSEDIKGKVAQCK